MWSLAQSIAAVVERRDLSFEEARDTMGAIMDGEASPAQIAAFLIALRMKGETGEEAAGFATAMRSRVTAVKTSRKPLVDTCGTGGDTFKTFNISTAAAFIAAGAGAAVAKHGNRAVSSKCGSADVLEALGARLDVGPDQAGRALDQLGIAFLFAPAHHPAMRHAGPVRKELGLRTVFNILGPLTNPAGASRQVMGVYDASLVRLVADALARLGCERGLVVYGEPGIDEVSALGTTRYAMVESGQVSEGEWQPEDLGLTRVAPEEIAAVEDGQRSGEMLREAISDPESPLCTACIGTAGCALWAAGETNLRACVEKARSSVASGAAHAKLDEYIRFTNDRA
jgi:anthranilate phosphoribosyltransferase